MEHSGFRTYFNLVIKYRKTQLRLYKWKKTTLESTYSLMRFCDRCSLILRQDLVPGAERKLEINTSIKDKTYFISKTDNGVHIAPWRFEKDEFRVHFELRRLERLSFGSNDELERDLEDTMPELGEVNIIKEK